MTENATLLDLTPILRPERESLLELLRGLSGDDWHRATECPEWNVKGIALHILGDDLSLLTRQRDAAPNSLVLFAERNPAMNFRELLDGFNNLWVEAARFFSPELLIELLRVVGDWSDDFYCNVGLATLSTEAVGLFATADVSPYWQVIAREYLERVIHQSQIRRTVGAIDLDTPLIVEAARVSVHLLAAWMQNIDAPTATTVTVEFERIGSWTWLRNADGWSVHDGPDNNADAKLTVGSQYVGRVVSRGLTQADAIAATSWSGAPDLIREIAAVAAPLLSRPS